jgi:hypothetical protein
MSTKAIREALDYLRNNPTADEAPAVARKALQEVEAIERSAKVLDGCEVSFRGDRRYADQHAAVNLLNTIAREAP